jgi:hypothetical protein
MGKERHARPRRATRDSATSKFLDEVRQVGGGLDTSVL